MVGDENDTNTAGTGTRGWDTLQDEQVQTLKEMNAKLLALLDTQGANKGDEEGKFYKN